jgi:hypothetical protein
MPYTLGLDSTAGYIEINVVGELTDTEAKDVTSKAISSAKQTGTAKFLLDFSRAYAVPSFFDLLELTEQYEKEKARRRWPAAFVLPASGEARRAGEFYVLACKNRGWYVEAFSDRPSAIDWLSNRGM